MDETLTTFFMESVINDLTQENQELKQRVIHAKALHKHIKRLLINSPIGSKRIEEVRVDILNKLKQFEDGE